MVDSFSTDTYHFLNYKAMGEIDSKEIWRLRNLPEIARWMVNDSFIPYENHQRFVAGLKGDESRDYFIIKDLEDNIIGSVNLTYFSREDAERGIYISPEHWHRGHAYRSLTEFYSHFKRHGIKKIITKVKIDNKASNSLERRLGASLSDSKDGYNFYELEL